MKKTIEYLREAKEKLNLESDYALAKKLGIERGAISQYQLNKRVMDDYTASKIAEILNIPAMMIIAAANAEREKDEGRKEYWQDFYKRLGGYAASIIFSVTLIVTPHPTEAATINKTKAQDCILCKIRRQWRKVKKAALDLHKIQISTLQHCLTD